MALLLWALSGHPWIVGEPVRGVLDSSLEARRFRGLNRRLRNDPGLMVKVGVGKFQALLAIAEIRSCFYALLPLSYGFSPCSF